MGVLVAATAEMAPPPFACPSSLVTRSLTLRLCCLSDTRVEHHDGLIRLDCFPDLHHLLEQLALLLMPSGGINDDDLEFRRLEALHAGRSDRDGICLGVRAVEGDTCFRGVLLKLVEGARTESVCAD